MTEMTATTLGAVHTHTHTHTQVNLNNIYNRIHKLESYLLVYVLALCKNYACDG